MNDPRLNTTAIIPDAHEARAQVEAKIKSELEKERIKVFTAITQALQQARFSIEFSTLSNPIKAELIKKGYEVKHFSNLRNESGYTVSW